MARLWPVLLTATVAVWLGALALTRVDVALLSALLCALLAVYATLSLTRPPFKIARQREFWLGPIVGMTNGVLTGMTGSFVVPGVFYLQAIGLPRDMLIQAMGMLFTVSTVALAIALGASGRLTLELGALSATAVIPAIIGMIIGMIIGQRIRARLSEKLFRRVFFIALPFLGGYIVARSLT